MRRLKRRLIAKVERASAYVFWLEKEERDLAPIIDALDAEENPSLIERFALWRVEKRLLKNEVLHDIWSNELERATFELQGIQEIEQLTAQ